MKTNEFLDDIVNSGSYSQFAEQAHETWRTTKAEQGWTYGPRDNAKKTNPLMLPFNELPKDIKGQNCLTPYAVANFFRTEFDNVSPGVLEAALSSVADGSNETLLDKVGEYVHSHFIGAMLAKGETVATRNDMGVYEQLTKDQKSWDLESAKKVAGYFLREFQERK